MSVNDMNFEQSATILTEIANQTMGAKTIAGINNAGDFVSVAQSTLKVGYDPLATAIGQVLGRTIFSVRPYYAKFKDLDVSEQQWGAITRKINYIDTPLSDDQRFDLTDGQAVDMYKVQKPQIFQSNFYGADIVQKYITIYKDQLDNAFSGAGQFSNFISGQMQNAYDQLEQVNENWARLCIINFIASKIYYSTDTATFNGAPHVAHLVTIYNDKTGSNLTAETVWNPENFANFSRWMFGYINNLAKYMSERSYIYHMNPVSATPIGGNIARHTPARNMKVYLLAEVMEYISASVQSMTWDNSFLSRPQFYPVTFWQSIDTPYGVNVGAAGYSYMTANGGIGNAGTAIEQSHVLGVMFDREAMGITRVNQWTSTTPLNAAGGYWNTYFHYTNRLYNDFTENAVVLLLD